VFVKESHDASIKDLRKVSNSIKEEKPPKTATDIGNSYNLRDELVYNTPLQKLFEAVYFGAFNLATACKKHLNLFLPSQDPDAFDPTPELNQISISELRKVIGREVHSIDAEREFDILVQNIPVAEEQVSAFEGTYGSFSRS